VDVTFIVCPLCKCDDLEVLTDLPSMVLCKCRKYRTAFTINPAAPPNASQRARKQDLSGHSVGVLSGQPSDQTDKSDRIGALARARRVLVPSGLLLSVYISRFASACNGIQRGTLRDAAFSADLCASSDIAACICRV
jgi:hypothetical protein